MGEYNQCCEDFLCDGASCVEVLGESEDDTPKQEVEWNNDPEWVEYIQGFETVIAQIATKYCSDHDMRLDCAQEARIALLTVKPEKVNSYPRWKAGLISDERWEKDLSAYCRMAIKFSILSFLDSPKTGNWYVGRTRRVKDPVTGEKKKQHNPARYSSYDMLVDDFGMQVDEHGEISWPEVSSDGLYEGGGEG